jgi:hypothetical protein
MLRGSRATSFAAAMFVSDVVGLLAAIATGIRVLQLWTNHSPAESANAQGGPLYGRMGRDCSLDRRAALSVDARGA